MIRYSPSMTCPLPGSDLGISRLPARSLRCCCTMSGGQRSTNSFAARASRARSSIWPRSRNQSGSRSTGQSRYATMRPGMMSFAAGATRASRISRQTSRAWRTRSARRPALTCGEVSLRKCSVTVLPFPCCLAETVLKASRQSQYTRTALRTQACRSVGHVSRWGQEQAGHPELCPESTEGRRARTPQAVSRSSERPLGGPCPETGTHLICFAVARVP